MDLQFRPTYGRPYEIRALVPSGTPLSAATATFTPAVRQDVIKGTMTWAAHAEVKVGHDFKQ